LRFSVPHPVRRHPEVCFVDTHPYLDGRHRYFIDAIHFTQQGDRQMAQAMFRGITNGLAADLASLPAGYASSGTR
jgi:hypothetical protein